MARTQQLMPTSLAPPTTYHIPQTPTRCHATHTHCAHTQPCVTHSRSLAGLGARCMAADPDARPTASEALDALRDMAGDVPGCLGAGLNTRAARNLRLGGPPPTTSGGMVPAAVGSGRGHVGGNVGGVQGVIAATAAAAAAQRAGARPVGLLRVTAAQSL